MSLRLGIATYSEKAEPIPDDEPEGMPPDDEYSPFPALPIAPTQQEGSLMNQAPAPTTGTSLPVESIVFVKELYPRLREDDSAIERYRAAIEKLPPITTARGHVLVDGFHRWQAYRREGLAEIPCVDLGNLTDAEILRESITRNAAHGQQLSGKDKQRLAGLYWSRLQHLDNGERAREIAELLSVSERSVQGWTKDARQAERAEQQQQAWNLWLECASYREIGDSLKIDHKTVADWCGEFMKSCGNSPPDSQQHFDIWQFHTAATDAGTESYFGKIPPQVLENLLWLYTEPGQIVFDPFAGGGTTIDVAKRMGRRVWSSDLRPSTPTLPIHQHDILTGWPKDAPSKVDLVFLDPPYWKQAAGKYSDLPNDLGNMKLEDFADAWAAVLDACIPHVAAGGYLAFIISPSVDGEHVIDHAFAMAAQAVSAGLRIHRRVIVPYNTQQATGQQVTWAREKKQLLKLYRDLVVMKP